MSYKSRSGYAVIACVGCLDSGSRRCENCLGRYCDKRLKGGVNMAMQKKVKKPVKKGCK